MVFILVFIVFMVLLSHLQDANIPDVSMQVMDGGSGQETEIFFVFLPSTSRKLLTFGN